MPQVYTIATKNAFSVLDDSDSEDVILAEMPIDNSKQAPTSAAKVEGDSAKRTNNTRRADQNAKTDRPPRRARVPETDAVEVERRAPRTENGAAAAPRPYSNPADKTGKRRAGPPVHDRLSGTGRGREMKKEGGGAHNWGNQTADFGGDAVVKPETETEGEVAAPVDATAVVEESPKEEGPKTISYSAYKAEQEEKRANLPQKDEGGEDSEADKAKYLQQGYKVYTKENKQAISEEKKIDDDEKSRPKAMHLAELAAQSGMQLRFGGERRGPRGADRTKSPKSFADGEKKPKAAPSRHEINLADNQAFPTLEAH